MYCTVPMMTCSVILTGNAQFPMQVLLVQLPKELLYEILLACDPMDVLMMEMTCKIIRCWTSTKHFWMYHLAKLEYDYAPDVGPHVDLDLMQAKDVKNLVIRAVKGYLNWNSSDGPCITRQQTAPLEGFLKPHMLLPGCKYILVELITEGHFGIWSIDQRKIVARHPHTLSLDYAAPHCAFLEGGKVVRVVYIDVDERFRFLQVVDFDLEHGHSTQLIPNSVKILCKSLRYLDFMLLRVFAEMVLACAHGAILLFDCDTKKLAITPTEDSVRQYGVVQDALVCMLCREDMVTYVIVVGLPRIFENSQRQEPTSLKFLYEEKVELPSMDPGSYSITNIIYPSHMSDSFICDPSAWGSAYPRRILVIQALKGLEDRQGHFYVQVHRLYLRDGRNASGPSLTYDSTSKPICLREFSEGDTQVMQSESGRCLVIRCSRLQRFQVNQQFTLQLSNLWDDDICLTPTDVFCSGEEEHARYTGMERYSGTIWHWNQEEENEVVLRYFD